MVQWRDPFALSARRRKHGAHKDRREALRLQALAEEINDGDTINEEASIAFGEERDAEEDDWEAWKDYMQHEGVRGTFRIKTS